MLLCMLFFFIRARCMAHRAGGTLPGQMASVSIRRGGAMEGKGKGGSSELALTALEWRVPRAATSGDHLQLAACSILI